MMKDVLKRALAVAGLALFMALGASAQLQVGENVNMSLDANLSFDYAGNYSNLGPSGHGISPSGNADFHGYYYDPGFLTFDVQPFVSHQQANSAFRSVFQSEGVTGNASIFSGSHFPGSITYSKTYHSDGTFAIPGVGNLTTDGKSDNLSLGWGIRLPDYPKLSFQFADGNSSNSILGTSGENSYHSKTFAASAFHTLAGFNLGGGYTHNNTHSLLPEFLAGEPPQTSNTSSDSYNFDLSHALPFHGGISAGVGQSIIDSEASGDKFTATVDSVNSGVSFAPVRNLDVGVTALYTNNLNGSLYQSLVTSGAVLPASVLHFSTHSRDISSHASYGLPSLHLIFMVTEDHRQQSFFGSSISADTVNEMVNYNNELLGGFLNATVNISQTSVNFNQGTSSSGLTNIVSYNRKVHEWHLNGSFNYSRNTQTVLVGYTSSGYGFGASLGRRLSQYSYFSINASGMKSTFGNAGFDNSNQSYSASVSLRLFSVSGSYSKASGISILTAGGLTPISNPLPLVLPLQSLLFDGKTYSFGASTTPIRGLVLSGVYSHSRSHTIGVSAISQNSSAQLNTLLQYKVRQLWITGGYTKVQQGFTITGLPATSDSAFYVGITRWFKFF